MARDYAQRGGGRKQARGRSSGGGTPGWIWLVVGLAIGLAFAAFVYIKRPAGSLTAQREDVEAVKVEKDAPRTATKPKKEREALTLPPKEKERFTFYELLPNQEVVVPRNEVAKADATKPPADAASYIIQVASFRDREEADRQKADLALLGVESRIETVTIDNAETFYRVRVGPLKDFGKVQIISNRLADNGIQALVVKVK